MKFITIGSDPEFFVYDPHGKPFPATLFAEGTKDNPSPIGDGYFEQRDNLSFEGNIPPAHTRQEFIRNMVHIRQYFHNKVADKGYSLSPNGVEYFSKRYLNTIEGMEFGCSSVISSWDSMADDMQSRPTPILGNCKFRVAGFHVHIGYDIDHLPLDRRHTDILIGRLFDLFVTIPSQKIKPEPERIETYGKWGMIRSKDYGVECRTLSSFFTQPEYLGWVWDHVMKIEKFIAHSSLDDLYKVIAKRYILGSTNEDAMKIFTEIFSTFDNIEILSYFDETQTIYETIHKSTHTISNTSYKLIFDQPYTINA